MGHAKKVKFVEVDKSGFGFCLSQKPFSLVQKSELKKIMFNYDVIMTSLTPYDIHSKQVNNGAKFDDWTPRRFGGVKADRHTDRIALYISNDRLYYTFKDNCTNLSQKFI